jgi:hypothetical protein
MLPVLRAPWGLLRNIGHYSCNAVTGLGGNEVCVQDKWEGAVDSRGGAMVDLVRAVAEVSGRIRAAAS